MRFATKPSTGHSSCSGNRSLSRVRAGSFWVAIIGNICRNMNAEREREAKLLVVDDDRTPEFGVTRPVSFAGQQSQADVAEFIEGAFCGGGNDQHQNKDAGQGYFGFHNY